METRETDVVVVGAGMAGLVTAVRASEFDVEVTVLEKGPRAGGSMYISHGDIWTFTDTDAVTEEIPDGNPELQALVLNSIEDGFEWLQDLGIQLTDLNLDPIGERSIGRLGKRIDPPAFTNEMVRRCEQAGTVHLQTPMEQLLTDETGAVTGVRAHGPDGHLEIRAASVVLATGGFQGNAELVQRYITDEIEHLRLRANPWSTGDGFQAARDVGAKTTTGLGTFYGHNLVADPAEFSPTKYLDASQKYGHRAVALDRHGDRFTDETVSHFGETLAQDTAKQAGSRAYYVLDHDLFESELTYGGSVGVMVDRAKEFGGHVADGESLNALREAVSEWELNGTHMVETIKRFNTCLRAGSLDTLDVPRANHHDPIDNPPFYVVAVQPDITYTMGGLDVTREMRVLYRARTSATYDQAYIPEQRTALFTTPLPNLFAAGVDVGNISHRRYLGGLSHGLVTGQIAGKQAAQNVHN